MKYIIYFLLAFVIVYLFYLFTVILQKKKYDKFKQSNQVMYFVKRYDISPEHLNMKVFTNVLGLTNAFIMATAFLATFLVDNFILQLLLAFIVIFPMIFICYHIIGKFYQKKEGKKNV